MSIRPADKNGPGAVAAARRAKESTPNQEEGSTAMVDRTQQQFRPGNRVRLIETGELLTVEKVLRSWDKVTVVCTDDVDDSDWRICRPEHLEQIDAATAERDEAADYAAAVGARIAADVAASGRTDADIAEKLGADPQEFRRLVDGRHDWTVPAAILLSYVLGVSWARWFDDEPKRATWTGDDIRAYVEHLPAERIVRRAEAAPIRVREVREIPDDEPGTGRFGLVCDECGGVVCMSRYPLPPMSVVCMVCAGL
ncbi:hypothetical protein ACFXNW_01355 [Nocardia sp. NPDC059180]|uniref:hypothetical protein n=1 Tax=Nocardia sp. NPDC059180 TaxID=3346761 RepID=UPI0036A3BC88